MSALAESGRHASLNAGPANVGAAMHRAAPLRVSVPGQTMAGALVDEIERVVILRERHRRLGEDIGNTDGFAPALAMMTLSIHLAKRAIGGGDLILMIAAYQELRSFDDE